MIEPRSSFVDADAVRLHYLEWDPGSAGHGVSGQVVELEDNDAMPIVLLHGLGASAETWSLMAQHLCPQHLLLAFDLRGHGQSDQPDDGYDLVTIAEDAICGMATLGLGQVALVGHGWGARVALTLAARHPALVSHLVLVDCPHVEPRHWPGMTRERFISESETPPEIYVSRATYLQALRTEMAAFWSPEVESILLAHVRELFDGRIEERLRTEQQRKIRASLWDDRALSYYGKITCPVLLVPAAAKPGPDDELPESLVRPDEFATAKAHMALQVARVIQRCSVRWMPDTAHDIQLQRPQTLAQAISDFLASA